MRWCCKEAPRKLRTLAGLEDSAVPASDREALEESEEILVLARPVMPGRLPALVVARLVRDLRAADLEEVPEAADLVGAAADLEAAVDSAGAVAGAEAEVPADCSRAGVEDAVELVRAGCSASVRTDTVTLSSIRTTIRR